MISFSEQMKRWAHIAGRPLNKFEQMSIARPFRYSAYWGKWSRLIKPVWDGYPLGVIELNLTPITGSIQTWEDSVKPMIMRCHSTAADKKDRFERQLPQEDYDRLVANVGYEEAQFMLNCDLWPMMDLEKFESANKGPYMGKAGVPFFEFRLVGTEGMAA